MTRTLATHHAAATAAAAAAAHHISLRLMDMILPLLSFLPCASVLRVGAKQERNAQQQRQFEMKRSLPARHALPQTSCMVLHRTLSSLSDRRQSCASTELAANAVAPAAVVFETNTHQMAPRGVLRPRRSCE